jgi:NADPH:quinone reductase
MQQAILVTEVGKPLTKGTRPIPLPPKGYVQIKVTATQLLPHDTYGRDSGLFFGERLPFVPGTNIAGIVTALGPETQSSPSSYKIGDAIFGLGSPLHPTPDMSGLQEYALLEVEASAKIPPGFTPEQVVTFPVNAVTSFEALFHPTMGFGFPVPSVADEEREDFDYAAQTILIIGGGSNVGKLGIQFAKLVGIGRIITIASAGNTESLKALGATHVIDRHLEPAVIFDALYAITGKEGVTHIYDCVSWEYSLALETVSKTRPSMLLTLHPKEAAEEMVREKGLDKYIKVGFVIGNTLFFAPLTKAFWMALPEWIQAGKLAVPDFRVVEGLDLKAVEEGLDTYRDGKPVVPFVVKVASDR